MQMDFSHPMVPAEFGYSTRGALLALVVALCPVLVLLVLTG